MENTMNAVTLGLGFHKFDGDVKVADVINMIGANFEVDAQTLVRVPQEKLQAIMRGESVQIPSEYVINSHKATIDTTNDKTIGVVGKDYGIIQNNEGFELLDMMCNSSVTDTPLRIVSAGLVHDFEPYIQAELPTNGLRVDGDVSETKFYVFAHTSHDGSSGLQIRFSPVRVICQNTFMANVSSKLGFTFKHSKFVSERVDWTRTENIEKVVAKVKKLNLFCDEYVEQMNAYKLQSVNDDYVRKFAANLFIDDDKVRADVERANYYFNNVETLSTRSKNTIERFMNVLHSEEGGQQFAVGSKLWLFNGVTNYFSNYQSYGSNKDSFETKQTKRFDSLLAGNANKKMERTFQLLAV